MNEWHISKRGRYIGCDEYVDRGGGWDSPPFNARISNRGAAGSKFNTINLGFRIVMEKH